MKHKALNQLLCAATVNNRFRDTLLRNPSLAISSGYYEHSFALTQEERDMVTGIQAQRFEDFAAQVYSWISGNGHGSVNHSGRNESVRGHDTLAPVDQFIDPYRTPVPVGV
jgi:hypothetical protein